jgi:hypothetical protein
MMMNRIVRAAFAASLLCATAGAAVLTMSAAAQADDAPKLSQAVSKPISEAQKAIKANDFPTALASVKEAQAISGRTPYDDYVINSMLAYVEINLKDYDAARIATEAAADSGMVPDAEKKGTFHNALLLSMQNKEYAKAITYGQQLVTLNAMDATGDAQLALAYYETKDMQHAQQFAQASVDASKAAGGQPDSNALLILENAQISQNNLSGAEATLEQSVVVDPDHSTAAWQQLTDIALNLKGGKDLDELYIFRLKLLVGAMSDGNDYLALASAAQSLGYPTEAVGAFDKGRASGKLSGGEGADLSAKVHKDAAEDQRLLPMIVASAEKSKTGEQEIKLGEDYWGYGRYADAETAARAAMAKGGLKDPGEGNLLLGAAQVAEGKYSDAVQSFGQVTGSAAKLKVAHLWSLYAQGKVKGAGATAPATPPAH